MEAGAGGTELVGEEDEDDDEHDGTADPEDRLREGEADADSVEAPGDDGKDHDVDDEADELVHGKHGSTGMALKWGVPDDPVSSQYLVPLQVLYYVARPTCPSKVTTYK